MHCCGGSPIGGIPRNWKLNQRGIPVADRPHGRSPFGGIPRNWKLAGAAQQTFNLNTVPPSGGSLEIGNKLNMFWLVEELLVPPSGGSLEIGNPKLASRRLKRKRSRSPFGGIPRNWKQLCRVSLGYVVLGSPFGGIPRNWKQLGSGHPSLVTSSFPLRGDP